MPAEDQFDACVGVAPANPVILRKCVVTVEIDSTTRTDDALSCFRSIC